MRIKKTPIKDLLLIILDKNFDNRGFFYRSYCKLKINKNFMKSIKQINISRNLKKFTLRGFHYQVKPHTENKILTVTNGSIYNVTIDLRRDSPTFLKKYTVQLEEEKKNQIYIPAGCANAFLTLNNNTTIQYLMSDFYEKINFKNFKGFRYDDNFFNISWPHTPKIISTKDRKYKEFNLNDFDK